MIDLAPLRGAFLAQAQFCRNSGSAFSALVLDQIAERLTEGAPYGVFLQPWLGADSGKLFADAVTLRLLGAFHYLALSGGEPELTALYPPKGATNDPARLGEALAAAALRNIDLIQTFMATPPQTNEVNRSLCLAGGFLTVAAETGLPLRCLELGASAGLIMNWDRYAYRFGGDDRWGPEDAPLTLQGDWTGGSPPLPARVEVVERAACDQAPMDVRDPDQALRLRSYVWADQTQRLARLEAAIALKRETGGAPEQADAADWSEAHAHPRAGAATVVYHSSFIFYPPEAIRNRIFAALEAAGRAATAEAPFAWLNKEPDPLNPAMNDAVILRLWAGRDGDGEPRRLAAVHPHGNWVRWEG